MLFLGHQKREKEKESQRQRVAKRWREERRERSSCASTMWPTHWEEWKNWVNGNKAGHAWAGTRSCHECVRLCGISISNAFKHSVRRKTSSCIGHCNVLIYNWRCRRAHVLGDSVETQDNYNILLPLNHAHLQTLKICSMVCFVVDANECLFALVHIFLLLLCVVAMTEFERDVQTHVVCATRSIVRCQENAKRSSETRRIWVYY